MRKGLGNTDPLSAKERMIVDAMLVNGFNRKQAAITAGYSPNTASQMASKVLKRPRVAAELDRLHREALRVAKVDAAFVLKEALHLFETFKSVVKPVLSPKGQHMRGPGPKGEADGPLLWTFDGKLALEALRLLGQHSSVQAFEDRVVLDASKTVVDILNAGRQRVREPVDITPRPPAIEHRGRNHNG